MSDADTVGTGDDPRGGNLSRILRLVHENGPLPRSDVTRRTGLNRSTTGALVADLVRRGLVTETAPDRATGVGRPSPTIRAARDVVAVSVVPEIDAVTVAVVGLDGFIHEEVRRATDAPPTTQQAVDLVTSTLDDLGEQLDTRFRTVGMGVSVPGLVRVEDGLVRSAPHLGWVDEPFAALLADAAGRPVRAANDANLGAWAEHLYGAGRGVRDLVYLNGGASGIGGGIISGGRPLAGGSGYAGEVGHTFVSANGIRCHCGAVGCLETEVSQAALLEAAGLPRSDAPRLGEALADPSPRVAATLDRQLDALATAIRNVLHTVDADVIVLGGFLGLVLGSTGSVLSERVITQTMPAIAERVTIVPAALGATTLLRGAAELAFAELLADPAVVSA